MNTKPPNAETLPTVKQAIAMLKAKQMLKAKELADLMNQRITADKCKHLTPCEIAQALLMIL